jgi:hypothetical protein
MATTSDEKAHRTTATPPDPESNASDVSLDKDDAAGLVGEHAQYIDPEVEKRVLRKIDLFLIPAMIVGMLDHMSPFPIHYVGIHDHLTNP